MKRFPLLALALATALLAAAQHTPLRKMSQTPLAGGMAARRLLFDRQGLMWIGTEQGLMRYDGYTFSNYRSDAYSPGVLPNNYIRSMTEDHRNGLWIGTRDGLTRYDPVQGTFRAYRLRGGAQARLINCLFTSADGTVWVGTNAGFARYDAEKDDFIDYFLKNGAASFAEDAKGRIYIGTWEGGLLRLDRPTGRLTAYAPMNDRNTVSSLLFDSRGRLWIGTWEHGIIRLDHPENELSPGIHRMNEGRSDFRTYYRLVEDSVSRSVWGCCLEGITSVHMDSGLTENYDVGNFCNDIQTDGKGNLWVLTQHEGILHLSTARPPFSQWTLPREGQLLPVNCIHSVFTADGHTFWLGLQPYGLARYDRRTQQVSYGSRIPGFGLQAVGEEAFLQVVNDIIQVGSELWIAGSSGLFIWQEGRPALRIRGGDAPFMGGNNAVNALYRQRNGVVWVAQNAQTGLAYGHGQGQLLTMREGDDDFSACDVRSLTEDSRGRLWLATDNAGIIRVTGDSRNPRSLSYRRYCPRNGRFPVDDAIACFEDSRRRLWAISTSGGLFGYDPAADRFEAVSNRYHIHGSSVYTIEEDAGGSLWMTTEHALVRLTFTNDEELPVVTSYGEEDGLTDIRYTPNASFRFGRELFFGNQKGFFSFIPDARLNPTATRRPRLVVTSLLLDDIPYERLDSLLRRKVLSTTPLFMREMTIPSDIRKFTVEFSLLTYSHQHSRYKYRLEGYDGTWHSIGNQQHSVTFQNLPSGSYELHLKAADSYGRWTALPYSIHIRVLPPWYRSWWACLAYALAALMLAYGVIRWYKNYLKTKNRLAMAVVFTNITHELLTPLTIISAAIDDLRGRAPQFGADYGLIQHNVQRLTRLLRQILEVRKSQAGQLKLLVARGDLARFIAHECENIRPMMGTGKDRFTVSCPPQPLDAWFDKDKVDKILYNLLSNAVKYNREGGRIAVTLTAADGRARLQVSDEGIGIPKDKLKHLYTRFLDGDYRRMNTLGTGIGLALTHDLVLLHHGHIDCRSQVGHGTVFTVTLPIGREAYTEGELDVTADSASAFVPENPKSPDIPGIPENLKAPTSDYSMLIAEDNGELLELMRRLFAGRYKVYTAQNGQQALNIIQRHDLDIVVTDVMMPVMDGIELTRRIKESADYGQLPVVMLTARTTDEDRNTGYETGADAYITKPFRMADLQLRIASIIRNRERIRRRFSSQTDFRVEEQHYSSPDGLFIQKAIDCVKQHLDDGDYDRDRFAMDMCVSSSTLYNKLRALTGQNVTGFIHSIRLKEACRLARQRPGISVAELSIEVGFNTPKYFTKCFKKEFGMLPSEYLEQQQVRGTS